jgi:hypothetical protein
LSGFFYFRINGKHLLVQNTTVPRGTCKMRNETKRNEINRNGIYRNETKFTETKRNSFDSFRFGKFRFVSVNFVSIYFTSFRFALYRHPFIFQLVEACHQYNKHKTDIIKICNALFVIVHQ